MHIPSVSTLDTAKLAKVLARLGSPYDGERATAGAMADRMVKDAGLTWSDVVGVVMPAMPTAQRTWREPQTHREAAAVCLANLDVLSEWEQGFCRSIARQNRLSPKQWVILDRVLDKVREFACAGMAA